MAEQEWPCRRCGAHHTGGAAFCAPCAAIVADIVDAERRNLDSKYGIAYGFGYGRAAVKDMEQERINLHLTFR